MSSSPFITVAIPHYNHRKYLEVVLETIFRQDFSDFEILVSDDCSSDDSAQVVPGILQESGRACRYYLQERNLGYDGNVRFCLNAARGRYVLLLGNDDALAHDSTLSEIHAKLTSLDFPEVAFTNYEDWQSGEVMRRAVRTFMLGAGPDTAAQFFRSFSFVSGLIYSVEAAKAHETDRWDSSIYYQIYIACRTIAAGGRLAALDAVSIRKDVRVGGETVPNYVSKWSKAKWSFAPRHTGLDSVIRVTEDAILPLVEERERSHTLRRIIARVLAVTYLYWLFEYRRVANWSFAVGIARQLQPFRLLAEYDLNFTDRLRLYALYSAATCAGLFLPVSLFGRVRWIVADLVRRRQQALPHAGRPS